MTLPPHIGILYVSTSPDDSLARSIVVTHLTERLAEGWKLVEAEFVSADQQQVAAHLQQWIDVDGLLLVLTLGSIGPAPTDVFPEATRAVCPKQLPGFGARIRQLTLPISPAALLLRPMVGIRNQSLIVNLPADPTLLMACLPALFPAIPNAVFLASGVRVS